MLAEQFGTLAALHEGRIDLGIGRGPGTFDESTARALRRGAGPTTDDEYRDDVSATLRLLVDEVALGPLPEPWMLSSSPAGAALAGELGLPLAFAHHIRPDNTLASLDHYREHFSPSRWCARPRVLICVETLCAETQQEAARLAGPMEVVKAGLLKGRGDIPFPTPDEAAHSFSADDVRALAGFRAQQAYGTPETVAKRLADLVDVTRADELMLVTPVYALADRLRSYELVRQQIVMPHGRRSDAHSVDGDGHRVNRPGGPARSGPINRTDSAGGCHGTTRHGGHRRQQGDRGRDLSAARGGRA